jgi:hypothetical protein
LDHFGFKFVLERVMVVALLGCRGRRGNWAAREVGEGASGEGVSRIIGFINEKICLSTIFWF